MSVAELYLDFSVTFGMADLSFGKLLWASVLAGPHFPPTSQDAPCSPLLAWLSFL